MEMEMKMKMEMEMEGKGREWSAAYAVSSRLGQMQWKWLAIFEGVK